MLNSGDIIAEGRIKAVQPPAAAPKAEEEADKEDAADKENEGDSANLPAEDAEAAPGQHRLALMCSGMRLDK